MDMSTEIYYETLERLTRMDAIRAIHAAYLQLLAVTKNYNVEHFDNGPALRQLHDYMVLAGHPGFKKGDYSAIPERTGVLK